MIGYGLGNIIISRIEANFAKEDIADQSSDLPTVPCFEMSAAMKCIMFENDRALETCVIKGDSPYMSASSQDSSEDDRSDDGSQVSSEDPKYRHDNIDQLDDLIQV